MTVEHFIPIHKGGTNDDANIIALCKKCNEEKSDVITNPTQYLQYLQEKHKKQLYEYIRQYMKKFDYIQRHNILPFEEYHMFLPKEHVLIHIRNNPDLVEKHKHNSQENTEYTLHLMTKKDESKVQFYLYKFFRKNLRKKSNVEAKEYAENQMKSMSRLNCIYPVENPAGEIILIALIQILIHPQKNTPIVLIHILPKDTSNTVAYLTSELPEYLINEIMHWNNLDICSVQYSVYAHEKIIPKLQWKNACFSSSKTFDKQHEPFYVVVKTIKATDQEQINTTKTEMFLQKAQPTTIEEIKYCSAKYKLL